MGLTAAKGSWPERFAFESMQAKEPSKTRGQGRHAHVEKDRAFPRGGRYGGLMRPTRSCFYSWFFPSPLSLDPGHLKEPEHPSMWGPVELVGIIAGPVFLLFLIIIIVFLVINYHQRVYHNRQRLDMEDPSCEMCLSKDKTLQDLVYDLSTSGSGSGTEFFRPRVFCWPSSLLPSRIVFT